MTKQSWAHTKQKDPVSIPTPHSPPGYQNWMNNNITIYTMYTVHHTRILYATFSWYWPSGSGEKGFLNFVNAFSLFLCIFPFTENFQTDIRTDRHTERQTTGDQKFSLELLWNFKCNVVPNSFALQHFSTLFFSEKSWTFTI